MLFSQIWIFLPRHWRNSRHWERTGRKILSQRPSKSRHQRCVVLWCVQKHHRRNTSSLHALSCSRLVWGWLSVFWPFGSILSDYKRTRGVLKEDQDLGYPHAGARWGRVHNQECLLMLDLRNGGLSWTWKWDFWGFAWKWLLWALLARFQAACAWKVRWR